LPVEFFGDWISFVDTPLTGREMAKVKKKVDRQTRGLAPQVPVPVDEEG
jgi:hypothetical protein